MDYDRYDPAVNIGSASGRWELEILPAISASIDHADSSSPADQQLGSTDRPASGTFVYNRTVLWKNRPPVLANPSNTSTNDHMAYISRKGMSPIVYVLLKNTIETERHIENPPIIVANPDIEISRMSAACASFLAEGLKAEMQAHTAKNIIPIDIKETNQVRFKSPKRINKEGVKFWARPNLNQSLDVRNPSIRAILQAELECPLCSLVFDSPMTISCGHTCRSCFLRARDHANHCPVCRQPFWMGPQDVPGIDLLIRQIIERTLGQAQGTTRPKSAINLEINHTIPLMVCLFGFPGVPMFLQIHEPKYKLLIRRCLLTDRKFGIVIPAFERDQLNPHDSVIIRPTAAHQTSKPNLPVLRSSRSKTMQLRRTGSRRGHSNSLSSAFLKHEQDDQAHKTPMYHSSIRKQASTSRIQQPLPCASLMSGL
ncbi:hypothetical protein PSHT_06669 [Puccinia striiformis]|uniref:RING-type domain-containing protein n=1 Tax=Puccinia striiformis TaxID=27350 RepID=A0A2S4W4N8_9BASI|nr:hypothetical protein PSHT_06669 [Puccinia striiformis]